MSSTEVLEPTATTTTSTTAATTAASKTSGSHHSKHGSKSGGNNSKRKNKHDRSGRKRSKSFTGCNFMPVLPSKFLLGGNIKDPLNLNSLQDEEINRAMNAVTPKSSPVPTPPRKKGQLEVIVPKNIHDPLNLIDCDDDVEYEQQLSSPIKKSKKKRLKKRRTASATMDTTDVADPNEHSEAKTPENSTDSAKVPEMPENVPQSTACRNLVIDLGLPKKDKNKRKSDDHTNAVKKFKNNSMDKIVSPVVPQPGAWLKRSNSVVKPKPRHNKTVDDNAKMPEFKDKNKQFQYGNYNRYYGYRNPNQEIDHRLRVFSHHAYLFGNKDILDIGCNIGHITLSVARDFRARSIIGIDIDPKLIAIARKNTKHYVKTEESPRGDDKPPPKKSSEFFPISMPILYGAIDIPGFHDISPTRRGFPNNVTFKQCNYILEDDNLINLEQPQFDVILCLSVTKWFHLNWGDAGLKQAFRRMYAQLRPGGKLILEPQHWASYKSKKKLTETIYKHYNSIEFFPEKFREYLLSPAVGFAKSEILGYPQNHSKGFQRPIQIFTKSTMFPSERIEATPINITPTVGGGSLNDFEKFRTGKYEAQAQIECVQHVYTDIFDNRYCGCSDENVEINEKIGEELHDVEAKPESLYTDSKTEMRNKRDCESELDCECEQVKVTEPEVHNSDSDKAVAQNNNTDNVQHDSMKSVENFNVDNT